MADVEFAVVGRGLIGSAAARHLSSRSSSVAAVGPSEPGDRRDASVHASHHDQGRLTRRTSPNRVWSEMTERTFDAMAHIEAATGLTIHRPVGSLTVHSERVAARHGRDLYENPTRDPVRVTTWDVGDDGWRDAFPMYDFPANCSVRHEPGPAGMVDPRALVAGQCEVAASQGCEIVDDVVTSIDRSAPTPRLEFASGMSITAERVVLAMGSYTNLFPVASRRLPVTVETETLMLSTVSDADGERLADAPVVTFSVDDPFIADVYMTPPLVYPDGRWKVKLGCNTTADRFPDELSELQAWFHHGLQGDPGEGDVSDAIRSAVSGLWPGLDFVGHELMPCVITMTADDHPIIDWIDDTTVVATGGNGIGAKSSDGWGGLAADLVTDTAWPEWLDPKSLALDRFEDQTVRL